MVIAVTGANGFIGRYMTEKLSDVEGFKVIAVVRSTSGVDYFSNKKVSVLRGDLNDIKFCNEIIDVADAVLHLAHSSRPMEVAEDIAQATIQNLVPSLNLLDAIRSSGRRVRLVYASSGGTVYNKQMKRPFLEEDSCSPNCLYGIEKYTVENYISHYVQTYGINGLILRISNPYGVLLESSRNQGLIGVVLSRIIEGKVIKVYGDPNNVRDYIHLDDLYEAFKLSLSATDSRGIYNIGSGVGHSVNYILDKIDECCGFKSPREYQNQQAANNLTSWVVLDSTKAKKELGWRPLIDFETGLSEMCKKALKQKSY